MECWQVSESQIDVKAKLMTMQPLSYTESRATTRLIGAEGAPKMADSNCTKCDGTAFEAVEITPQGVDRALLAIRCVDCGGVVGVVENDDVVAMIHQQNRALIFVGQQFGMKLGLDTE